jgi:hypothetical protein
VLGVRSARSIFGIADVHSDHHQELGFDPCQPAFPGKVDRIADVAHEG